MISVTKVLTLAGLIDTTWFTVEGRDRGSAVHRATHIHDTPGRGELDEESIDDERVRARYSQYCKFIDETGWEIVESEKRLVHPTYELVGHVDKIMQRNGHQAVCDIKPPGEYAWHGLQLAAYAKLAQASGYQVPMLRYNLYLGDKGYKLVPRINPTDWSVFRAAMTVAQFKEMSNGD